MAENNRNDSSELKIIPLLYLLYRKLAVIILVTLLFTCAGLGYSLIRNKTTYTASKPVMFVTNITTNNMSAYNDVAISKVYLPDVAEMIKTPTFIEQANKIYESDTKILAERVSIKYSEDSLIFTLSYTDTTSVGAEAKLEAIIASAKLNLDQYIQASEVNLKPVQNRADRKTNNRHVEFAIYGFMIGLVVSCAGVLVAYALDNTVKDKREIEEITGANLIAYIDNNPKVDKKK